MIAPTVEAQANGRGSQTLARRRGENLPKNLLQREHGDGASSFVAGPPSECIHTRVQIRTRGSLQQHQDVEIRGRNVVGRALLRIDRLERLTLSSVRLHERG